MPGILENNIAAGLLSRSPIGILGSGIRPGLGGGGIAPYGIRHSGEGAKGLGFFGAVPTPHGGYSTEISAEDYINGRMTEFPLMVPTLTAGELSQLIAGGNPAQSIYDKALRYAQQRIQQGLSPFAAPGDMRYPVPR